MSELTVTIEDTTMADSIKQAISMLKGVVSVKIKYKRKSSIERAIEDVAKGRIYEADSVDDLLRQCKA